MQKQNQGFTLIELLVVVLIIGILAAVALPQYKVAVTKARVSTYLPIVKSIAEAEERYYLANGGYTYDSFALDLDMPTSCTAISGTMWKCDDDAIFDFCGAGHCVRTLYCPGYTSSAINCESKADVILWKYFQNQTLVTQKGKWACSHSSNLGKAICKSLVLN